MWRRLRIWRTAWKTVETIYIFQNLIFCVLREEGVQHGFSDSDYIFNLLCWWYGIYCVDLSKINTFRPLSPPHIVGQFSTHFTFWLNKHFFCNSGFQFIYFPKHRQLTLKRSRGKAWYEKLDQLHWTDGVPGVVGRWWHWHGFGFVPQYLSRP